MADFTATEVVDGSVLRFLVVDKDIYDALIHVRFKKVPTYVNVTFILARKKCSNFMSH